MMRFAIISGDESLRLLISQFLAIEWPDVEIQELCDEAELTGRTDVNWAEINVTLLDENWAGKLDFNTLTELQSQPICPPIIYLIDPGHEARGITAMELGAVDYLRKHDISKTALLEAVKVASKTRRAKASTVKVTNNLEFSLPSQHDLSNRSSSGGFRFKDTGQTIAINGYKILRELGSGGMSTVFLAERRSDRLQLALKILENNLNEDDEQLKRFIREYGIIASFNSKHVVQIYDQGFTDDHIYIAMEYFPSGDLKARLGRAMAPKAACMVLYQITQALAAIHAHDVIHRDLKPQNVMFRDAGELAIVDFGIAKVISAESSLSYDGQVVGTPYYMSPEQGMGVPLDARSDLYSLGIIFYELLTGNKPYKASSPMMVLMMHRHEAIPRLPENLRKFQDVIDRLLAKEPGDRFSSANALLHYMRERWTTDKAKATV